MRETHFVQKKLMAARQKTAETIGEFGKHYIRIQTTRRFWLLKKGDTRGYANLVANISICV